MVIVMNKKRGTLIVMEGACDGIGKSTQFAKLTDKLTEEGYEVVSHHFPSYNTFHGAPVERYLSGELGNIEELNPYFINSLYANDRACAWFLSLKKDYEAGKIILLDRYTTSSLIYQASVIKDIEERKKFIDYVVDYEYNKLGIAEPDLVLFLEAPFNLVTELRNNRTNYEGNKEDIHEKNLHFMKKVYDNAMFISNYLNWEKIVCNNGQDKMKDIDEIHDVVYSKVLKKLK